MSLHNVAYKMLRTCTHILVYQYFPY